MLPRVLRRVFEHVAAAKRDGPRYQVFTRVATIRPQIHSTGPGKRSRSPHSIGAQPNVAGHVS